MPGIGLNSNNASLSITLVDCIPWQDCLMCPFWVSSNTGKCLLTLSAVSPGNVTRFPFWAAVSNVAFVGKPNAACTNQTISLIDGRLYTFISMLATLGHWLLWALSSIGTIHRPVSFLHPWSTGGNFKVRVKLSVSCTVTPVSYTHLTLPTTSRV